MSESQQNQVRRKGNRRNPSAPSSHNFFSRVQNKWHSCFSNLCNSKHQYKCLSLIHQSISVSLISVKEQNRKKWFSIATKLGKVMGDAQIRTNQSSAQSGRKQNPFPGLSTSPAVKMKIIMIEYWKDRMNILFLQGCMRECLFINYAALKWRQLKFLVEAFAVYLNSLLTKTALKWTWDPFRNKQIIFLIDQ